MNDPVIEVSKEDVAKFAFELQRRLEMVKFDEPTLPVVEDVETKAELDEPVDPADALPQNGSSKPTPGFVVDHTVDDNEPPPLLDDIVIESVPFLGRDTPL